MAVHTSFLRPGRSATRAPRAERFPAYRPWRRALAAATLFAALAALLLSARLNRGATTGSFLAALALGAPFFIRPLALCSPRFGRLAALPSVACAAVCISFAVAAVSLEAAQQAAWAARAPGPPPSFPPPVLAAAYAALAWAFAREAIDAFRTRAALLREATLTVAFLALLSILIVTFGSFFFRPCC
jgi:hypothetical protein